MLGFQGFLASKALRVMSWISQTFDLKSITEFPGKLWQIKIRETLANQNNRFGDKRLDLFMN